MKIYNKSKRNYQVKSGEEIIVINPEQITDVTEKIGKKLLKNYPREIITIDKMNKNKKSGNDFKKKESELDKREEELNKREKALNPEPNKKDSNNENKK